MAIRNQPLQKIILAKARAVSDISVPNKKCKVRALKARVRARQKQRVANGGARARSRRRQQKKAIASVGRAKKADRKVGNVIDKATLAG